MPSITSCCFVMGLSHASHTSPSAGPLQNLGVLLSRQPAGLKLLADEVTNPLRFHLVASRAIGNVQHAKFTGS